ncbi:response regulator [Conexibacter stalactiti]|uniref:Response regulator n=1 Tax=Conexibacter stalactiti TaxID=1940611 RepID=A0ABU4I268_9ACTN|nr:response regulator [Conexibacter stalactiti]MDW5598384.1 response regulator [Conexibacter stalactiti]MEC5039026.1 response regulator [Conexibacter stalactiti]
MPLSVLLVDDDVHFRRLAAVMLRDGDAIVAGEAADCATGLHAARTLRPQAAIVDVNLPDGSGTELAAGIAELPNRPRVALVSSDADAVTSAEALRLGAVGFWPKSELADGIAELLRDGDSEPR